MSFYGQVLYEFSKIFDKINIKNITDKNENYEISMASGADVQIEPTEKWDILTLSSGNRWVALNADRDKKVITIGHAAPGKKDKDRQVIGFSKINEEDIPKEAKDDVTSLSQGDYIKTTTSDYDSTGHSTGASTVSYFKLPISDEATVLGNIEERVDNIEEKHLTISSEDEAEYELDDINKGISINDYLTKNNYITNENLEDSMKTYLQDNNYVTTELTGQQEEIYDNIYEFNTGEIDDDGNPIKEERYPTIIETIGQVDGETGYSGQIASMVGVNATNETKYSVSEGLSLTSQQVISNRDGIRGANARITNLITKLKELGYLDKDYNE